MKTHVLARRTVVVALAVALGFSAAVASAATARVAGNGVALDSHMVAPAYQLRVTGPADFVFEQNFAAGVSIGIDAPARGWADGSYNYEITALQGTARVRGEQDNSSASGGHTESGSFLVKDGVVQTGDVFASRNDDGSNAAPVPNDQVIADDLIVQGSTCVGLDCVNNESFGFDTIRLKENNTRIKFDDTSVGAFPATDWQLTANDSASGGANKFSIEDITAATVPFTVTGAAPNNSVFVSSTGRVGFRTSTPVLDLHVTTSNTPAIRLEQTNAGGFSAQTWDIGANEANFFVRDITSGSRLPFRIRPGAPTSSVDISASGNVGVGTASPSVKLNVSGSDGTSTQVLVQENNGTAAARDLMRLENNGPTRMRLKNTATSNEWSINAHDSDFRLTQAGSLAVAMTIFPTGNVTIAGTLTQNSDRNSKENFKPLDGKALLQKIAQLDITEWNFKYENDQVRHIGPMAQDFHAVFGLGEREDRIAPLDTSGVALAAVKALQQEIGERDQRISDLEARLAKLDALTRQVARMQEAQAREGQAQAIPATLAASHCDAQAVQTGL